MVTRKRFRTVLNALALYTIAALVIGYFGVNAYSGNRGLRAKQDLDQQIAQLSGELAGLRAERGHLGTPRLAPAGRQHRSRHARRARPRAAQLRRSPRIDPAHQATLTTFPGVSAPVCQSGSRPHMSCRKGRVRAPIGFRPAVISAIGEAAASPTYRPPPRRKMAVASNKPAAQPASPAPSVRRACGGGA